MRRRDSEVVLVYVLKGALLQCLEFVSLEERFFVKQLTFF